MTLETLPQKGVCAMLSVCTRTDKGMGFPVGQDELQMPLRQPVRASPSVTVTLAVQQISTPKVSHSQSPFLLGSQPVFPPRCPEASLGRCMI